MNDIDPQITHPVEAALKSVGPAPRQQAPAFKEDDTADTYAARCAQSETAYTAYYFRASKAGLSILPLTDYQTLVKHWRAVALVHEWIDGSFAEDSPLHTDPSLRAATIQAASALLHGGGLSDSEFISL